MGTKLKFSSAYHPQMDGQIEVINKRLGDLLRCLVKDNVQSWDLILLIAKFTYNNSISRSTSHSSFKIVIRLKSHQPIDLTILPIDTRTSLEVEKFAKYIHQLHEEI